MAAPPHPKTLAEKAKEAFDNSDISINDGTPLAKKDLQGDALEAFKRFQKGMMPDYPSKATEVEVDGHKIIIVQEENDGGTFYGLYDAEDGMSELAEGSCSESGDPRWDN